MNKRTPRFKPVIDPTSSKEVQKYILRRKTKVEKLPVGRPEKESTLLILTPSEKRMKQFTKSISEATTHSFLIEQLAFALKSPVLNWHEYLQVVKEINVKIREIWNGREVS